MTGMSIAGRVPGTEGGDVDTDAFFAAVRDLIEHDDYEIARHRTEPVHVGSATPSAYPIETFETDAFWIGLEGTAYGRTRATLREELTAVAERLFDPDAESAGIADWLFDVDGTFVVYAVEKSTGAVAVLPDALGRLPVYHYRNGETVYVSRDLSVITTLADDVAFDRLGIAQFLLLGFLLGERTLFEGVSRLTPATALTIRPSGVETTTLHRFDFGRNAHAGRSVERNASELVALFEDACRRRTTVNDANVVALSGGLDSRCVLAGVSGADRSCGAATMNYPPTTPGIDVDVARRLTTALDVDWRQYHLDPPSADEITTLLRMTGGMNGVGLAQILQFYEGLRHDHGPDVTYFTGDGGDMVFHDLTPSRRVRTDEDLVDYIVAEDARFSPETVAALTRVPADRLRETIRTHVAAYPETDPAQQYVHFSIYEKGVNWLGEGEDRNRGYFWGTTPFYALPVFVYAMNCPDDQKAHYALYREFLSQLDPRIAEIDNANYGVAPASAMHTVASLSSTLLSRYPAIGTRLLPTIKRLVLGQTNSASTETTTDITGYVRDQRARSPAIHDLLHEPALDRLLATADRYDRLQLQGVFTVTSLIDTITSSRSVLETRSDGDGDARDDTRDARARTLER